MRKLLNAVVMCTLAAAIFAGCGSRKIIVKNCSASNNNLFICDTL